ncbi:MAG TPA: YqaA family protein [Caulobacteraceae bacterium]|nr:YqaA family protein [Caulobacteraceae bacterium]
MLRRLYDRLMALAASRNAPLWLALVSFAESSFFPAPPDLMLAPMVLARPDRAWRNAAICTAASVLGGVLGYAIGYFAAPLGQSLLTLLGQSNAIASFQAWYAKWGVWLILIKGLTPIPYKLVTITSGVAHFNFAVFIAASVATRGARFFLVAGLLKAYGPPIQAFVEKRLTLVTSLVAVAIVVLLVGLKFLEH